MNIIPFVFSKWTYVKYLLIKVSGETKQGAVHPAFAGSLAYAMAFSLFLIWYFLVSIVAAQLYLMWVSIPVTLFVGYQTGRYALRYVHSFKKLMKMWRWNRYKRRNPTKVEHLRSERSAIISELMDLRKDCEKEKS
tara:strand:- start:970 stop:1377 length:408 start_codon:yes stop_codon:yes gene_type:complete